MALLVAAVITGTGSLAAQACLGRPALGSNSMGNVGGGASFFDGGKGFGAHAAYGGPLYGLAAFDYYDFDDTTLSVKTVSAGVGYQVSARDGSISVCPGVNGSYGFGLEVVGIDVTALAIAPGLAVGVTTEVSPTVRVAPFAQAAFVHTRVTGDAGPFGEYSEDESSGLLRLGLGLIFNERFSVVPSVSIPLGLEDGDTMMNIAFSVALAR
jgi:hypothetical protein